MKTERTLTLAAALALLSAPILASEGGGQGGPFEGNIGNALWTLVIFGLVILVLGRFAWKPILGGLQQREDFIRTSLSQAKADREAAEVRLKEYSDKLLSARSEASAIVDEARRDAEELKRSFQEETQAEANRTIERARREIKIAQETAVKELYVLTARLTTDVAGKILEREINPADHERLIRDSIQALADGKRN
ncbi:MAG: F-type H+-transporting ATPase subunit b [Acidobacteriota bacterium]|nr:F-type H+-transporting ATPase subunit b [Acidobacteriota bacterium]